MNHKVFWCNSWWDGPSFSSISLDSLESRLYMRTSRKKLLLHREKHNHEGERKSVIVIVRNVIWLSWRFRIIFVEFLILISCFLHYSSKPHKSTKPLHKAAPSAPVCSDPASFKTNSTSSSIKEIADEEIVELVLNNKVKDHELEKRLDCFRAVTVRRMIANRKLASILPDNNPNVLDKLPSGPSLDY